MYRVNSLLGVFLALLAVGSQPAAFADEQPTQARLTVGKDVYNVPLGKAFAVRIAGQRVTLKIEPQSTRSFSESGVAFDYPMSLTPGDRQGSDEVTIWSMQGPTTAIMLQKYDGDLDPKSLREVLVENLSETIESKQTVKLTGAERAYQGVQLRTKTPAQGGVPATEGVQNIFTFANTNGVFALLVQEVHAVGAKDSEDYSETLRLLGVSLKTGKEPATKKRPTPRK